MTFGFPPVPFKAHAARRHRTPRQRHRVTNWAAGYDAALRQRGSLTVWSSEAAIAAWRAEPRVTPSGQPHHSALAILTALTPRAVSRLALRRTEGLIGSILQRSPTAGTANPSPNQRPRLRLSGNYPPLSRARSSIFAVAS